uniref:Uncharacterized protein n=1 Tax=Phage sp. ctWVj20 TaxID=2826748 RepID=A0A8S5NRC5_9VIRU|nr:MAG TPA: hypothetical protein [Phage sp. ctWVj20]
MRRKYYNSFLENLKNILLSGNDLLKISLIIFKSLMKFSF